MAGKGSFGWGLALMLGGVFFLFLGMILTTTLIGAVLGIPMILFGALPLLIWGGVLLFRARAETAKQIIREGLASGIKEGLASSHAAHQVMGTWQGTEADINLGQFTKKCPACAEQIKLEALVCRFCGHRFSENEVRDKVESLKTQHAQRAQDEETLRNKLKVGLCPRCDAFQNFEWGPEKLACKSCGSQFARGLAS